VPEHSQVLQPSTLVQVIVELQPAMGAHPVRPVQPLLLPDIPPLLELLLPVEPLLLDDPPLLPAGAPEEDPLLPLGAPLLLPPPSGPPSSRALPPHAKTSDAATPKAKSDTDRRALCLMSTCP
jgi:hypothetical protein